MRRLFASRRPDWVDGLGIHGEHVDSIIRLSSEPISNPRIFWITATAEPDADEKTLAALKEELAETGWNSTCTRPNRWSVYTVSLTHNNFVIDENFRTNINQIKQVLEKYNITYYGWDAEIK